MTTVRERAYEVLRSFGMTTVFGNPGFTELPFLTGFPLDFKYILGLQEASVIGMADGYSQASGVIPVLVNLHNAPGVGNAMGNLKTAFHNKTPLILTAGQQRRDMTVYEAGFYNKDARDLPKPYVKWSYEPARAQDIPAAIARAVHIATQDPAGPVFLALPLDDWEAEADPWPESVREVTRRVGPDPVALAAAARRIAASKNPAVVAGAAVDRIDGWSKMVEVAERLKAKTYQAPAASRAGFPEDHRLFRGPLFFDREILRDQVKEHDLILVFGAAVFDLDTGGAGPMLPDGAGLILFTDDVDEAARAPIGDAIVGNIALLLEMLLPLLPATERAWPEAGPQLPPAPQAHPIAPHALFAALEKVRPADSVIVLEASSHAAAAHMRLQVRTPGGFYYAGVGGIGNGLPCAVGVQLAIPQRRVVCATGDGALLYSIQALWTAVQHNAPVIVVVLDNSGYVVLKESGDQLGVGHDQPGLEVAGIDFVALAKGFGAEGYRIEQTEDLEATFQRAFDATKPILLSVTVDPAIKPLFSSGM